MLSLIQSCPLILPDIVTTQSAVNSGVGLGSVIAVVCSWHRNQSILWAILAGIFSWFYVIYYALTEKPGKIL
jgi:branched-subunit amino acid transport protein